MEINNKSVRGIYLYSKDVKFEAGDFVVSGTSMYICIADAMGKSVSDTNYYKIYLGENIATDLDFEKFAAGTVEDKFMSAFYLGKILNSYMSGFSEKGIVNSYIGADEKIYLKDYFGNESDTTITTSYKYPLDNLMATSSLNNAIFSVDRSVVEYIFGPTSGATSSIILRQITYFEKDSGNNVRIQELVDTENGLIKYRYSNEDSDYEPSSSWVSATVNQDFKSKVDEVMSYYYSKLIELEREKSYLKTNFRFKKINFEYINNIAFDSGTTNAVDISYGTTSSTIPYTGTGSFIITICTKYQENSVSSGSTVWRNDSTTIDLVDVETELSYGIVGGKTLTIVKNKSTFTFKTSGGSVISDIYYRQSLDSTLDESISTIVVDIKRELGFDLNTSYGTSLDLSNVKDLTTGSTINLTTIYPSGCTIEFKVSPSCYWWTSNGSSGSWSTKTTDPYTFRFKITDWTTIGVTRTFYIKDNMGASRYTITQTKTSFSFTPVTTDLGGPPDANTDFTNSGVSPQYLPNPEKITNIYYVS